MSSIRNRKKARDLEKEFACHLVVAGMIWQTGLLMFRFVLCWLKLVSIFVVRSPAPMMLKADLKYLLDMSCICSFATTCIVNIVCVAPWGQYVCCKGNKKCKLIEEGDHSATRSENELMKREMDRLRRSSTVKKLYHHAQLSFFALSGHRVHGYICYKYLCRGCAVVRGCKIYTFGTWKVQGEKSTPLNPRPAFPSAALPLIAARARGSKGEESRGSMLRGGKGSKVPNAAIMPIHLHGRGLSRGWKGHIGARAPALAAWLQNLLLSKGALGRVQFSEVFLGI
eukprot:557045-Pelagomonas_calceolata.AAC.2